MHDPIAYTYEADTHCPGCAFERFGRDANGFVPASARDGEGNPVGAIAPWDEASNSVVCGTCGVVILDVPQFTVIENTPGYLPMDDDPPAFDEYSDAVAYLNERAAEYADDADGEYEVEYGIASADNLAAVIVHDRGKTHDLGLVIQVVRYDV